MIHDANTSIGFTVPVGDTTSDTSPKRPLCGITPRDEMEQTIEDTCSDIALRSIQKYNYYRDNNGEDAYDVGIKIMQLLYPHGVDKRDYADYVAVWETVRKLCVIAQSRNENIRTKDGDSSVWDDVAGWAVRAISREHIAKDRKATRDVR